MVEQTNHSLQETRKNWRWHRVIRCHRAKILPGKPGSWRKFEESSNALSFFSTVRSITTTPSCIGRWIVDNTAVSVSGDWKGLKQALWCRAYPFFFYHNTINYWNLKLNAMESPLYIFTASNLNAVIDKLLASSWNKAMDEFMLKYEYEIQS